MILEQETEHLRYTHTNQDIHWFTLKQDSRRSVDEILTILDNLYRNPHIAQPVLILIDVRLAGVPDVNYAFQKASALFREIDTLPQIRLALIYDTSIIISFVKTFFELLPIRTVRRRFLCDESAEPDAVEWLINEREMYSA